MLPGNQIDINIVDDMIFEIDVQLLSCIDRKEYFSIDMKNQTVTPYKLREDGIEASLRGDKFVDKILYIEDSEKSTDDNNST